MKGEKGRRRKDLRRSEEEEQRSRQLRKIYYVDGWKSFFGIDVEELSLHSPQLFMACNLLV